MHTLQRNITLDFGRQTLPVTVFAKQNDTKSRFVKIIPLDAGKAFRPGEETTARLRLTKPDGYTVLNDAKINEDGSILIELTNQILATAGTANAEIALYQDGALLSSQLFTIEIKPSAYDPNAPASSEEFDTLNNALAAVDSAVEAAKSAAAAAEKSTPSIGGNGHWYLGETDTGVNAQGPQGETGETGPQGKTGARGEKGEKGDTGDPGKDGEQGPAGPAGPQGKTGDPGPKGDTGSVGPKGDKGADGQSAYQLYQSHGGALTETKWLASLAQGSPAYAQDLDWLNKNGDRSKLYLLPNGYLYAYGTVPGASYTNVLTTSTDESGAVFNGTGYQTSARINSSATVSTGAPADYFATGFIPVSNGDTLRFKNAYLVSGVSYNLFWYDATKTKINGNTSNAWATAGTSKDGFTLTTESADGGTRVTSITPTEISNIAYMRFTLKGDGAQAIITRNEEIAATTTTEWFSTGVKYAVGVLTEADREQLVEQVVEALSYVGANNQIHVGTYTMRYNAEDTADITIVQL